MANYYTDIPELKYHLNNPMMERICELKEREYRDKEEFDYAPQDYADAIDSYDKVLEITGEITGEIIAPNAEGVDAEGPHCANGRVEYASGTKQNLDAMVKAGLNGMTMPRRFGGLNFPITPYTMCAEIVAAADAGFGNIWSLQDCIETLYEFGNEDQHSRFIPRICAGRNHVYGPDRAGRWLRPAIRDAKGYLRRERELLAVERRKTIHHEWRRGSSPRIGPFRGRYQGWTWFVHVYLR